MKQIKMSIETAREMYNGGTITTKNWLLENFTKEELEPKKGFTWEDSFDGMGFFITNGSEITDWSETLKTTDSNKNVFKTREQALSSLAFAQLSHIVAKYNEGKKSGNIAYAVMCSNNLDAMLFVDSIGFGTTQPHMVFLTKEDALISMDVNKELWEQYWMLKK